MNYITQMPFQQQIIEGLELIRNSLSLEISTAEFYGWLLDNIPQELTKPQRQEIGERLLSIQEDEIEHIEIFKNIYRDFTGEELKIKTNDFKAPINFIEGIKTGLFQEINSVKRYRDIMSKFPGSYYKDILFNVISDELLHADLFNYIYTTTLVVSNKS